MQGLYYIKFFSDTENPPYVNGDVVRVFYDEINDVIVTTLNGSPITSGPTLGSTIIFVVPPFGPSYSETVYWVYGMDDVGDISFSEPPYQYCELTTLVSFASSTAFPYANRVLSANHPSCVGNVCDIIFRGAPQITKPSDAITSDGEIKLIAESSVGVVKYGFYDVPYADMPNTTGIFSGLPPGIYTIYAKDANGCSIPVTINLSSEFDYGIKYRLQYMPVPKSINDVVYESRIDIFEKGYIGPILDIKAVDEPFVLRMRGDNEPFFTTILSTECSLKLLSETNLQYLPMFTQSDRQYQIRFYKRLTVDFSELWRGWVKPKLYREDYTSGDRYSVVVEATDSTANFSKQKFADSSGNPITGLTKLIDIIAIILNKTGIELPIHVADNLYESAMDSLVSDDPNDQTWIYPNEIFQAGVMCDVVLKNILSSKGARVVQWAQAWWIIRMDELVTDIDYRIFTKDGVLTSNDVYSPLRSIMDVPGAGDFTWINARQGLEVHPAVGVMTVRHELQKIPNGVKNGGFDEVTFTPVVDVFGNTSYQITEYKGWALILNGTTANYAFISNAVAKSDVYGYGEQPSTSKSNSLTSALTLFKEGRISKDEYNKIVSRITENDLPNYALLMSSPSNSGVYGEDAYVLSADQPIVFTSKDAIKFGFDYYTQGTKSSQIEPPFIKFKISVKLDNTYYLQADGRWSTDSEFEWIEIIVPQGKYNSWSHIDIAALLPNVVGTVDTTYTIKLMHGSLRTWVIGDEADLRDFATVNLPEGYRIVTYQIVGATELYRFYELVSDTLSPDNSPSIIHPDDYGTFDPPSYSAIATYNRGDKVKVGSSFYVSTHDNNINHTPGLSPLDWAQFAGKTLWKLTSEIQTGILETAGFYGIKNITVRKFDNVNVEFFPLSESAPEFKDYKITNNSEIDNDIELQLVVGDAPVDIVNSKNIYQNIYRLSDGTNTQAWARRGQSESMPLLALLAKQYTEQLQFPRFKLTGDISGYANFIDSFSEKGRKFLPMFIEINDFNNYSTVELIELTDPGGNSSFNGEFNGSEFGQEFDT